MSLKVEIAEVLWAGSAVGTGFGNRVGQLSHDIWIILGDILGFALIAGQIIQLVFLDLLIVRRFEWIAHGRQPRTKDALIREKRDMRFSERPNRHDRPPTS